MAAKSLLIIALSLCNILLKVHSLQCYDCYDCNVVNDTDLITCGGSTTDSTASTESTVSAVSTASTASNISTVSTASTSSAASTESTASTSTSPASTASTLTTASSGSTASTTADTTQSSSENPVSVKAAAESYYCLKVTTKVNNTNVIIRTCAVKSENTTICEDVTQAINATQCSVCDTDKCNSAISLKLSLPVLITFLLFQIKF